MKKLLITGGPVHAHLDDVKIVTNTFKGGLMSQLAINLLVNYDCEIVYLCSDQAKHPDASGLCGKCDNLEIVHHAGFQDYMDKVLTYAPDMDGIILGAAVANLIPHQPIKGKFPSHNYKPGDLVPLIFQIAPRVIDKVQTVAPKVPLFGFKLLSAVPHDELITAAYGVLRESKAHTVFANDRHELEAVYAVTKERGEHKLNRYKDLPEWIWQAVNDKYYHTRYNLLGPVDPHAWDLTKELEKLKELLKSLPACTNEDGILFGTAAVRCTPGFLTTTRGKKSLDEWTYVQDVDHETRQILLRGGKATLNAPLLDWIFKTHPDVHSILHTHEFDLPAYCDVFPYAPPGTIRDSQRDIRRSFSIEGHGSFHLYNQVGSLKV